MSVRVLFAAERDQEPAVRQLIEDALSSGRLRGPDGVTTSWDLLASEPGEVRSDEVDHAERLRRS